ncbi:MAG TPA: hypothetical protein VFI91_09010 [Longimicrobiaceae bacterium]|nr:hypothetical protein [Longimicrobiaceae bacterium]
MYVYLRSETVELEMREIGGEGLVSEDSDLVPVAFFVNGNETPSFRALLPPDTLGVLSEVTLEPVTLGVLAEEPEDPAAEVHAMVGLTVPVGDRDEAPAAEPEMEPWRVSAGDPEAWRGDRHDDEDVPRTALLAFAPLVRLERKLPDDFAAELADLLESALAGSTRPALEARVDRMLGDL